MNRLFLATLIGLALLIGFGFLFSNSTDTNCNEVNTALFAETPKQTLGYPKAALTRQLSEKACNFENQGKLLWNSWRVNTTSLIFDATLWLAVAGFFVYGAQFVADKLWVRGGKLK